jgi:hypothetical protein
MHDIDEFQLMRFAHLIIMGSWAGVTLTAPVPKDLSTRSSATILISLPIKGKISVAPIKCLYLLSLGLTATAVSPSMVSGLVVATTIPSSQTAVVLFFPFGF